MKLSLRNKVERYPDVATMSHSLLQWQSGWWHDLRWSILYNAAKYLAAILNPLTGKNGFTIKNSECFVNKIKDLEVPPFRKMVSSDVSAHFTSIVVDEAIHVIWGRLQKDTALSEKCELSVDQIITHLEFSLNTTYFVCDSVFYCQFRGTPMESPISPG